MKTIKATTENLDLSYLEKFVLNSFFIIILYYIYLISHYNQAIIENGLRFQASIFIFFLISLFFLLRTFLYFSKSTLSREGDKSWSFCKSGKKYTFECSEISSIKKSFFGLYSSLIIKIGDFKLNIPAETQTLSSFISALNQHLPEEQINDLLKFHHNSLCVSNEMEKKAKFLRIFCFFIPPISFFIARNVWEYFFLPICFHWVFLSLIYPLFWTVSHWFLLKISVRNFAVFSKISVIWALLGVFLYMAGGIVYRNLIWTDFFFYYWW